MIAGPTAVGKTEVAIRLAQHLKAEIVSADSRQIYKDLEIGTAKPSKEELAMVPHHFINSHSIDESFDAGKYGEEALAKIHQLFENHEVAILCGGSGLYIKAVLEGFDDMPIVPDGTREKIIAEFQEKGIHWLQEKLKSLDPEYFASIDIQNPHRLMRALELRTVTDTPLLELRQRKKMEHPFQVIKIGLEVDREELYRRIDSRMDRMIDQGLFKEASHFYAQRNLNALQTVGYREIFDYVDGLYDKEEAIRLLKRNSRRYAKRQLTWFKRDPEISWFAPSQIDEMIQIINS